MEKTRKTPKPAKTIDSDLLEETEQLLREHLQELKRQIRLLKAKQDHVQVYDKELADEASTLNRTMAMVSSEIRRFKKHNEEAGKRMELPEAVELSARLISGLPDNKIEEFLAGLAELRKRRRGALG